MVLSLFILSSFSYPSLGYYPSFNLSLVVSSSFFSSLGRHPRFYLHPICVRSSTYHPRFYLRLVDCLLCYSSLWYHPSFYLGLFLVPLGSKHFDPILGWAYVHCSFLWFPIIIVIYGYSYFSFVSHNEHSILWVCLSVCSIPWVSSGHPPSLSCFRASPSLSLFNASSFL